MRKQNEILERLIEEEGEVQHASCCEKLEALEAENRILQAEVGILRVEVANQTARAEAAEAENQALRNRLNQNSTNTNNPSSKDPFNVQFGGKAPEDFGDDECDDECEDESPKDKKPEDGDKSGDKEEGEETGEKQEKKPRTKSERAKSGLNSGGQPGHKGVTLHQVANPDKIVVCVPQQCQCCGCGLSAGTNPTIGKPERRQVFDIPEPVQESTEYQAITLQCTCGGLTKGAFPQGVNAPVSMGPRTHATVAYLSGFHHIPEGRIAHILQHLYGMGTCVGTVGSIITRVSEKLTGFRDHLLATVYAAGVVHLDETGIKVSVDGKAKCYWLHVACTPKLACFRVDSRGEVFNPGRGTIVHDCLGSYFGLPGVVRHGLCGQHILRELQSIIDQSNEPWARKMRVLLKRANHAINDVIRMLDEIDKEERAKPNATQAERDDFAKRREAAMAMMRECERSADSEYDAILKEAIEYHESLPAFSNRRNKDGAKPKNLAKRKGHALAERLVAHKAMVLLFTQDLTVPFTNNTAEQALRMAKVRMKVSGCFRTLLGAENFAILRSVIVTAQRQGWNLIETLLAPPAELIAKLVSA